jgi:hypothetical protein
MFRDILATGIAMMVALGLALFLIALLAGAGLYNAIIPLGVGVSLAVFPQFLAKSSSPHFESNKCTYRILGIFFIGVGIFYLIITLIAGSV